MSPKSKLPGRVVSNRWQQRRSSRVGVCVSKVWKRYTLLTPFVQCSAAVHETASTRRLLQLPISPEG